MTKLNIKIYILQRFTNYWVKKEKMIKKFQKRDGYSKIGSDGL